MAFVVLVDQGPLGVVGAILICGAVLIICVSNLRNHRDYNGEEKLLLPQH